MCRFYRAAAGNYVRLCYVTGSRGARVPMPPGLTDWEGGLEANQLHQAKMRRQGWLVASSDECQRCGQPLGRDAKDDECGDCRYRARLGDYNA